MATFAEHPLSPELLKMDVGIFTEEGVTPEHAPYVARSAEVFIAGILASAEDMGAVALMESAMEGDTEEATVDELDAYRVGVVVGATATLQALRAFGVFSPEQMRTVQTTIIRQELERGWRPE